MIKKIAREQRSKFAASLAKLTAPGVKGVYLRKRLFKQLDEACSKPVIWVTAPAGSGKTTLPASYLVSRA